MNIPQSIFNIVCLKYPTSYWSFVSRNTVSIVCHNIYCYVNCAYLLGGGILLFCIVTLKNYIGDELFEGRIGFNQTSRAE